MPAPTYYDLQQAAAPVAPAAPVPKTRRPGRGRYRPATAVGRTTPLLTVGADSRCVLSKPLRAALDLRPRQGVEVVVPAQPGGQWYLHVIPTPGPAVRRLPGNPRIRVLLRLPRIAPAHFAGLRPPRLAFVLGAEAAGQPGCYQLLPVAVNQSGQGRPV